MIINLFSTFDPCTGIISLNWIRRTIFILIINYNYWISKNNIECIINKIIFSLEKELFIIIPYKGSTLILLRTFIIIIFNNMIGLLPYVFTSSSHILFSLSLALPLWITLIIYGWTKKSNKIFAHLVPMGTPVILIPFIIIIETIRNVIRPGSLAVRLAANIIAGHLLISLLGSDLRTIIILTLIIIFITLIAFELAVAIIQSYVFITLITLYSREI